MGTDDRKRPESPIIECAVRTIDVMTHSLDVEVGAIAFKIWTKRHDLDPAQCVEEALKLYREKKQSGISGNYNP